MNLLSFSEYLAESRLLQEMPWITVGKGAIDLEMETAPPTPEELINQIQDWLRGVPVRSRRGNTTKIDPNMTKEFAKGLLNSDLLRMMIERKYDKRTWQEITKILKNTLDAK